MSATRIAQRIVRVGGGVGARKSADLETGVPRFVCAMGVLGIVAKRIAVMALIASGLLAGGANAQKPPLLAEKDVAALANELSAETAKRNLEVIATFHRQRGSKGFHSAAELVAERARAYGLSDVQILEFPADWKIFYGTQRSRPAWDAEVGELGEVKDVTEVKEKSAEKSRSLAPLGMTSVLGASGENKIASYAAEPVVLAD